MAQIDSPAGAALVILSQPGEHLRPLEDLGAKVVNAPPLSTSELTELAKNLGFAFEERRDSKQNDSASEDSSKRQGENDFIKALSENSVGNALYATYICREVLKSDRSHLDPISVVRSLPAYSEKSTQGEVELSNNCYDFRQNSWLHIKINRNWSYAPQDIFQGKSPVMH